jgi:hypothetical protein
MSSGYESGGYGLINLDGSLTERAKEAGKTGKKGDTFKNWTNKEEAQLLVDAKNATTAINRMLNAANPDEARIAEKYEELKNLIKQKDKIRIPRLKREMAIIVEKVAEIETKIENIRLRIYYKKAREQLSEIKKAFADADYTAVKVIHTRIKQMAVDIQKEGKSFAPLADRIIKIADSWFQRAHVRLEFADKKLSINGIITNPGPEDANTGNNNDIIINNKLIKEGSEFNNYVVQRIERNRVTFLYKGETIGMIFRRY